MTLSRRLSNDRFLPNRPPRTRPLAKFSLDRDGQKLIPYIKAAQGVKSDIRFWASPWTPPVWMKTGYKTAQAGKLSGWKASYFDGGNMKERRCNPDGVRGVLQEVRSRLQGPGHQHRDRVAPERARLRPELPVVSVG